MCICLRFVKVEKSGFRLVCWRVRCLYCVRIFLGDVRGVCIRGLVLG